jgi:hypothetical protein
MIHAMKDAQKKTRAARPRRSGRTRLHNLHLPLPAALYRRLRAEAERTESTATGTARRALEEWLEAREQILLRRELDAYVRAEAGSEDDLDVWLESATLELLGRDEP